MSSWVSPPEISPALSAAFAASAVGSLTGSGADETATLAAILAAATNGQTLRFDRRKTITVNGSSLLLIDNKQNLTIDGLSINGTSANPFKIINGSANITFRDCTFTDVGQVILLLTCSQIIVDNCLFDHTGYGVIQQVGYVSSFVKVINCTARNMQADFVEANCTASAPSEGWTITGNHFLGSNGYPTVTTEKRFVGITAVKNVVITDNVVRNTCGDAAIHLEDVRGQTIVSGNILENCVGAHPYLYILNTAKDVIVEGNWFIQSDITLPATTVMDLTSGNYLCNVVFANNQVLGNASYTLSGINVGVAVVSCTGNIFRQLATVFTAITSNLNGGAFNDNTIIDCNVGINAHPTSTGGGGGNLLRVEGNHFGCNTSSIDLARNTNGTGGAVAWTIIGNYFAANAVGLDTADFVVRDNICAVGKSIAMGGTYYIGSVRCTESGNVVIGSGGSYRINSNFELGNVAVPGTPIGGGTVYVEAGSLKYKGSSGTVTLLGLA